MSDDPLLSALARRAREERDEDRARVDLERVTRGEVSETDVAASDEERALFRPLDAAAERRIADAILASGPRVRVVKGAPSRKPRVTPIVLAFAAAAAIALFFLFPRHRDELPVYAFELSGNVAEVRGDEPKAVEGRATLHRDATLEMVLRPRVAVTTKIATTAALLRDGAARAWSPPIEISPDGAVRIVGPVASLFPDTERRWEIVVAIGPEGALPRDPAALLAAAAAPPPGVRVVRAVVDFAK
ncbi:MAG: hypothetical protein HYV09_29020 [Deltaproteobacteria bacterium]|nr:hypothetical protein [Deltaproteobacteria bacterium]